LQVFVTARYIYLTTAHENTDVTLCCDLMRQALGDQVLRITRPIDKKQVLFYNSKELRIPVSEGELC